MLKEKANAITGIARAIDVGTIAASFAVAAVTCKSRTRIGLAQWFSGTGGSDREVIHQYALLILLSVIVWLAVTEWRESYRSHRAEQLWPFLHDYIVTQLLWVMSVATLVFVFKLDWVSRIFFFTFLPLSTLMLVARQLGARAFLQYIRAKGFNLRRVIVIGESARAREFSRLMDKAGASGYLMVKPGGCSAVPMEVALQEEFDEAFVTLDDGTTGLEQTVLKLLKLGKRVHIVPGLFDGSLFRQTLGEFAGVPVLSVGGPGIDVVEAAAKRIVDVLGATTLLVVLIPVLVLLALLVKLSSPGPILFTQERLGRRGRRFRIYKFRTMSRDSERKLRADPLLYSKYVANNFKLPKGEDPRIARGGNFLRSTSLDELPQLFNVLKGDMSLVGPRPIVPPEIEKYGDYGPLFLSVKPGLTGYWQINGRSKVSDYSERTALDIQYIRDQSLKVDVRVLIKTIPAVLRRKGAH